MKAIVNVSENWGIGYENRLLFSISADLRHFRALTSGKTVVYGRKTLSTFPNQQPLKHRRNIIMSTDYHFAPEGAEVCRSFTELLARLRKLPSEEIFVIGGGSIYWRLLPYCSHALVTKTLKTFPADRYFPDLDHAENWRLEREGDIEEEDGISFQFLDYVNLSVRPL